jgi:hypothetical protein
MRGNTSAAADAYVSHARHRPPPAFVPTSQTHTSGAPLDADHKWRVTAEQRPAFARVRLDALASHQGVRSRTTSGCAIFGDGAGASSAPAQSEYGGTVGVAMATQKGGTAKANAVAPSGSSPVKPQMYNPLTGAPRTLALAPSEHPSARQPRVTFNTLARAQYMNEVAARKAKHEGQ